MRTPALVLLCCFVAALPVLAADGIRTERVHFKAGSTGATLTGRLHGDQDLDYVLGARAGQHMSVLLHSDNPQNYFNILPPGSDEALFVGSTSGGRFEGTLPATGDYRIRVYLMRAAARRGEQANYSLKVQIGGEHRQSAAPKLDFADSLAGGPDFWEVSGVAAGDQLNLRREPTSQAGVIVAMPNGTVLRNHGCEMHGGQRWCQVSMRDDPQNRGWVSGHYLRESSR